MKGWFYESYRHSLAAKGIKSGMRLKNNFLIKEIIQAGRAGSKEAETRAGVAMMATRLPEIPSSKYAELTLPERRYVGGEEMKAAMRPRERRFQYARDYMNKLAPIKPGEDIRSYEKRLFDLLGQGFIQSYALGGREEYFNYLENGEMKTKFGEMTVGEYIDYILKKDDAYKPYRTAEQEAERVAETIKEKLKKRKSAGFEPGHAPTVEAMEAADETIDFAFMIRMPKEKVKEMVRKKYEQYGKPWLDMAELRLEESVEEGNLGPDAYDFYLSLFKEVKQGKK